MGMGDKAELASAAPMPAGSYAFHPAGAVHWDGAGLGGETIVQVIGMGPVETVQIDPKAPEFLTFPNDTPVTRSTGERTHLSTHVPSGSLSWASREECQRLPIQPLELHCGTQARTIRKIEGDDLVLSDAVEVPLRTKP
jgi:hypothetical protein